MPYLQNSKAHPQMPQLADSSHFSGLFTRKLLTTHNILEIEILSDNYSASIQIAHGPRLVELADNLLSTAHCFDIYLGWSP